MRGIEVLERRELLANFPALASLSPAGSLVYASNLSDDVTVNAQNVHLIDLPQGQKASLAVRPQGAGLRPVVEFRDPSGSLLASAIASGAGSAVAVQHIPLPSAGSYSVRVSGMQGSAGAYSVDVVLNATLETLDTTPGTPLPFNASLTSSELERWSAVGRSTPLNNDQVVFQENFDGASHGFLFDNNFGSGGGLWHVSTGRSSDGLPGHSPPRAMYFGRGETPAQGGDYAVGATGGAIISPQITLPVGRETVLRFAHFLETEGSPHWDIATVSIDAGAGFVAIASSSNGTLPTGTNGQWITQQIDLTPYAGLAVSLRFSFDTLDGALNSFEGWFIDDVRVVTSGFLEEEDELTLDLTGFQGRTFDFLLGSASDQDFSQARLELFGPGSSTPLAVGSAAPLGVLAENVHLAILNFVVPVDGVYRFRVSNSAPGLYNLVALGNVIAELEPNDQATDPLRRLRPLRRQALGFVSPQVEGARAPQVQFEDVTYPAPPDGKEWLAHASPAALAFLPSGVTAVDFLKAKNYTFPRPKSESAVEPVIVPQEQEVNEIEPNNDFHSAQYLPLGFQTSLGESAAIELRGMLGLGGTPVNVMEPDNAIPQAHLVQLTSTPYVAMSSITRRTSGSMVFADYDWFRIDNLLTGQQITVDIDTTPGPNRLDSVVGIYNQAGTLLAMNDDGDGVDSYLTFPVPTPGTYYVVVRGYGVNSDFQTNPFDPSPSGALGSEGNYKLTLSRNVADTVDYYRLNLEKGDILGVAANGGAGRLTLFNEQQELLMESSQDLTFAFPVSSPLRSMIQNPNAVLHWVVDTTQQYYLRIDRGTGNYQANFRVFRPKLESDAPGARQILFLDFDGQAFDARIFGGNQNARLSPLVNFLPRWGLNSQDHLNAVIDAIVGVVQENLSTDIRQSGNNGDFAATGIPGQFDIEIRNSRDHADPFGQPNVSRVIVGGTIQELGVTTIGIAESIDVGNFDTEETAVVLLDLLSASASNPNSLNQFIRSTTTSMIDLIGIGVGNIVAHEAGHFFGGWHTFQFNSHPTIMDQGGSLANLIGLVGLIFGDGNEKDVDFDTDVFVPNEGFGGRQNSHQVISFGLATGGVSLGPTVTAITPTAGNNPNLYVNQIEITFSKTLASMPALDLANYTLRGAGADQMFNTADDILPQFTVAFDNNRHVTLALSGMHTPLPVGRYQLMVSANITDLAGNRLNARVNQLDGSPVTHSFSIILPEVGDRYLVELFAQQQVEIEVNALLVGPGYALGDLNAELLVYSPQGVLLATDRDSLDGTNPRLQFQAPADGSYQIQVVATTGSGPYRLRVLGLRGQAGDFDLNGVYDCGDINLLTTEIATGGTNVSLFDLTMDGLVNQADLDAWLNIAGAANLGAGQSYRRGDATLNGQVNLEDFQIWFAHRFTMSSLWCQGDFDANGVIDGQDFHLWLANRTDSPTGLAGVVPPTPLPTVRLQTLPTDPSSDLLQQRLDSSELKEVGSKILVPGSAKSRDVHREARWIPAGSRPEDSDRTRIIDLAWAQGFHEGLESDVDPSPKRSLAYH